VRAPDGRARAHGQALDQPVGAGRAVLDRARAAYAGRTPAAPRACGGRGGVRGDLAQAQVRWPNDVVVTDASWRGMLAELRDGKLVIGVGVNANLAPTNCPPTRACPRRRFAFSTVLPSTGPSFWPIWWPRSRAATGGSSGTASPASSATSCAAGGSSWPAAPRCLRGVDERGRLVVADARIPRPR